MSSSESVVDIDALERLSFEESLRELETIVRRLESGDSSLEQAISDYTRGTALKKICEKRLKDAQLKVEKIIHDSDSGDIEVKNFDSN